MDLQDVQELSNFFERRVGEWPSSCGCNQTHAQRPSRPSLLLLLLLLHIRGAADRAARCHERARRAKIVAPTSEQRRGQQHALQASRRRSTACPSY